jgi:hypothetical protein
LQWSRIAGVVVQRPSNPGTPSEMIPGSVPIIGQKVTGLKSESVPSFIPES